VVGIWYTWWLVKHTYWSSEIFSQMKVSPPSVYGGDDAVDALSNLKQGAWPIDAIATVASGDFYMTVLLPMWLKHMRDQAKFTGHVIVGCDRKDMTLLQAVMKGAWKCACLVSLLLFVSTPTAINHRRPGPFGGSHEQRRRHPEGQRAAN